ncbi:MAG: hypothetical protein KAS94_02945 [Desulfobulbaceae bacterium]|nr:hypothetical protein [Desulfobulbaceae bacterium]
MDKLRKILITGVVMLLANYSWATNKINDRQNLICSTTKAYDCTSANCLDMLAENLGAPRFFNINFKKKKMIPGSLEKNQRPTQIERIEKIDGKIILQGAEDGFEAVQDGLGWSLVIMQSNGNMIFSASGDNQAFIVFGACVPR